MKKIIIGMLLTSVSTTVLASPASLDTGGTFIVESKLTYKNSSSNLYQLSDESETYLSGKSFMNLQDGKGSYLNLGSKQVTREKVTNTQEHDGRCSVDESIVVENKKAYLKLNGSCKLEVEELERVLTIVYGILTYEALKENGREKEFGQEAINNLIAISQTNVEVQTAVAEILEGYIKDKYSIDGKEIRLSSDNSSIILDIRRELKLKNKVIKGSLFNKELVSFSVNKKQISQIYEKTLPLYASKLVDSFELANYSLSIQKGIGTSELYNKVEVQSFDCKVNKAISVNCDTKINWSVGFKTEEKVDHN